MKKTFLTLLAAILCTASALATNVTVKMNTTSPTMSLLSKTTGDTIAVGEPESSVYTFEAPAGTYVLTAFAKDSTTVNGTIELNVTEQDSLEFIILTCTVMS